MRPVSRKILIHAASYAKLTGASRTGEKTYATAVNLNFIRCEPVKEWKNATTGEMKDDKLTLFFDCVNSEPVGTVFSQGDKITFNGAAYSVRTVKDFSPHHYEVILK